MLLDHTTAFADCQPVELLAQLQPETSDTTAGETPALRPEAGGVLPTTLVETDAGFKKARDLRPGDQIFTFDGGLRDITEIRHAVPRLTAMVHVPAGALGNDAELTLPSDLLVALDSDIACDLFGTPVVVSKLISLVGYKGITTAMPERMARLYIECEEDELIWTEGGLLINAPCASADDSFYTTLSFAEARALVSAYEAPLMDRRILDVEEEDIFAQQEAILSGEAQQDAELGQAMALEDAGATAEDIEAAEAAMAAEAAKSLLAWRGPGALALRGAFDMFDTLLTRRAA